MEQTVLRRGIHRQAIRALRRLFQPGLCQEQDPAWEVAYAFGRVESLSALPPPRTSTWVCVGAGLRCDEGFPLVVFEEHGNDGLAARPPMPSDQDDAFYEAPAVLSSKVWETLNSRFSFHTVGGWDERERRIGVRARLGGATYEGHAISHGEFRMTLELPGSSDLRGERDGVVGVELFRLRPVHARRRFRAAALDDLEVGFALNRALTARAGELQAAGERRAAAAARVDAAYAMLANAVHLSPAERRDAQAQGLRDLWSAWLTPPDPAAHLVFSAGLAARQRGDWHTASDAFEQCIFMAPRSAEAYHQSALLHYEAGDTDLARRDCDHALQLEPRHLGALLCSAALARLGDDAEREARCLRNIEELVPQCEMIEEQLQALRDMPH